MEFKESGSNLVVTGLHPDGKPGCTFAISRSHLLKIAERGEKTYLGQLQKLAPSALNDSEGHVFQGLERPLCDTEDNMAADKDKYVYTSKPLYDYEYKLDRLTGRGMILPSQPPFQKLFAIIVTPNLKRKYRDVDFWIEQWYWLDHLVNTLLPVGHDSRYTKRIR